MRDKITKEELKKELYEIIEESQNKAHKQYDNVKQDIKEKRKKADEYVQENPEKSMLTGLGIGVIIGFISSWFFSKRK
jgi:ElaB/YqjD/DUF883 family membrane-anchored ribosome-binding protein